MAKENFVRTKPHINIGILILIFGILSGFSLGMVVYGDIVATLDTDGDTIPDNEELRSQQPLFFAVTDNQLTFSSFEGGTSPTSDGHEVGHWLGLSHAGFDPNVEINLSLYDDVSTGIPILLFNLKYDSLIEFVDSDSNGYFDPGVDPVVNKTDLTNLLRVEFGYGVDGQPAYYSEYSTLDGVFNVNLYTSREHVLLGRGIGHLAPNELKSSLRITNYVPITGGTSLALNLSLSSNQNLIFSGSGLPLRASVGVYEVNYKWLDWATSDGMKILVNTTVPSPAIPSTEGEIYINFGEVVNVTYDPRLSWHLPYPNTFNIITDIPWTYIAMGSIGLLMVATTTHVIRKRPGRTTYQPIATSSNAEAGEIKFGDGIHGTRPPTDAEKSIPETLKHRNR